MADFSDGKRDPYNQDPPMSQRPLQEPGEEADPVLSREVPHTESGEARWVREENKAPEAIGPNWTLEQGMVTPEGERIEYIGEFLGAPTPRDELAGVDHMPDVEGE